MSLFIVNTEKCNRDHICVENCPRALIEVTTQDDVPIPTPDAKELCNNCGHCVAICPTGALSLQTMPSEDCLPIRQTLMLRPEQVEQLLCSRRSIRTYTNQVVNKETLTHLIHLASYAPTGGNSQPVQWQIIYEPKEVQRLAGLVVDWMRQFIEEHPNATLFGRIIKSWDKGIDMICRNAPHVIITHALKDQNAAPSSCNIALTYLELATYAYGLGACWGGYFHAAARSWIPMQQALELPKGHMCFGAMMIGYPKYNYHRIPLRNPPKIIWKVV